MSPIYEIKNFIEVQSQILVSKGLEEPMIGKVLVKYTKFQVD